MTEIVAAHLERVAREIVEAAEHTNKWTFVAPVRRQLIEGVAAALAACAREERQKAIEDVMEIVNGSQSTDKQTEWVIRKIGRSILERAVGEKGQ